MASYAVPQVEIHQLFSEIPVSLTTTQIPFVFGPKYILHRYENDAEKPHVWLGSYTGGTTFFTLPDVYDENNVDKTSGYAKLYGDNVRVSICTISGSVFGSEDSGNVVKIKSDTDHVDEIYAGRYLQLYKGSSVSMGNAKVLDINNTGTYVEITIDMEITAAVTKVDVCEVQDGVEFPSEDPDDSDFFWKLEPEPDSSTSSSQYDPLGVTICKQLTAKIVDSSFTGSGNVLSADLYVTYRELDTTNACDWGSLTMASEVPAELGTVDPANPIAQAVYNAALNAGGQTVRYMSVRSDDLAGYAEVLNKATLTSEVYFLVPATRDGDVITLVKSHVEAMSKATIKRWRIAFVSTEVPDEDPIYTAAENGGANFTATSAGNLVTFTQTGTDFQKYVKPGDILRFNFTTKWGREVYSEYTVKNVASNHSLRTKETVGTVGTPAKAEIYHPLTTAEKAENVRNLSRLLGSQRVYNVFPSTFTGNGTLQTGEFAAAAVAGLVSSCLPQQPVTNLQLTGITDVPEVYQNYTADELNTMASGGTFIVMQDMPNDQVYVRHQISTAFDDNNLNTAELSVTKNVDSISYFFDDLLSPYIGKYNITPELLEVLRNMITKGIVSLSSSSYGLYGPQLIADGTSILLLEQDATFKDHVNCSLQLNIPYPLNRIILNLYV